MNRAVKYFTNMQYLKLKLQTFRNQAMCTFLKMHFLLNLQMRQKTKEIAAAYEETRPLSDGSGYDDNSIVIMRDKHRIQVNPVIVHLYNLRLLKPRSLVHGP